MSGDSSSTMALCENDGTCTSKGNRKCVDELSHEITRCQKLLPQGHLPIAGSSDLFTLSLKPKTFGSVYWWFHETDDVDDDGNYLESAGYLLAGSFDEFLTRIALLFGGDEESKETTTSKRGATRKKPRANIKQLLRLVNHDHTPEKIKEIEQVANELGDLSGIQDGEWPFINISSAQVVHCLLEAGLNPEITDTDGHSLLWQCAGSMVGRGTSEGVEMSWLRYENPRMASRYPPPDGAGGGTA